jgi:tRNA nucleotidyltransferase (CCA-adding enzyme)
LNTQTIRAVGEAVERFSEDALRILRAFRFSSVLGFEIEQKTFEGIRQTRELLRNISVERVEMEFSKLLTGAYRTQAIDQLLALEIETTFPVDVRAGLQALGQIGRQLDLDEAWTLLCYFNQLDAPQVQVFLQAFKHSNQFIRHILQLLASFKYRLTNEWTIDSVYRYGLDICYATEKLILALGYPVNFDNIQAIDLLLPIHQKSDLAINGKDILAILDRKQGVWIGKLINDLEFRVLHGDLVNQKEVLISYIQTVNLEQL